MKKFIVFILFLMLIIQSCYSNSNKRDVVTGSVTIINESIFDRSFMFYDNICQKDLGNYFIKSKQSINLTLCMEVFSTGSYGDVNYSINLGSWVHKAWIAEESELSM